VLPVFGLPKSQLMSCQLRDAHRTVVSLAPIHERTELSYEMLAAFLKVAGLGNRSELYPRVRAVVESRPWADDGQSPADDLLRAVGALAPALARNALFTALVEYLDQNHIVFTSVNPRERSHILAFALDQRFPDRRADFIEAGKKVPSRLKSYRLAALRWLGLAAFPYDHEFVIGAGSTHLEVEAPGGVAIMQREVQLPGRRAISADGASRRRARILVPRTHRRGRATASLRLRQASGILRTGGPMVASFFAVLMILFAHFAPSEGIGGGPGVTLLLILPALVSLVAARPDEHPFVTKVIRGIRVMTVAPICLSALAASAVVFGWPDVVLDVIACVAVLLACLLWAGALLAGRPRPTLNDHLEAVGDRQTGVLRIG
jgi:hypothetical protein